MFFWKSEVEKAFHFLIKNGFHLKKYLRSPEEEYIYSKNNIVLEVLYLDSIGEISGCIDIILTAGGKRGNILDHSQVFGSELLETLKTNVEAVTPLEQISIYADFIKANISKFLSL